MQVGNEIHDVRFSGGRYGILTENTTPYWPFTILDATFEVACATGPIREHSASLTLVRVTFRRVPVAIEIDKDYVDQLWVKDSRFEDVSTAIVISREKNAMMQVGVENAVCRNVAVFRAFRESGKTLAARGQSIRGRFIYGRSSPARNTSAGIDYRCSERPASLTRCRGRCAPARDRARCRPTASGSNVRTLGFRGTAKVDDTDERVIRICRASHRVPLFSDRLTTSCATHARFEP
jgi:hypothetical protein